MSEVKCMNCGEYWTSCECWDTEDENNTGHQVLALRLRNGLTKSKYLKAVEKARCPKCGSNNTEVGRVEDAPDGNYGTYLKCNKCGYRVTEEFE